MRLLAAILVAGMLVGVHARADDTVAGLMGATPGEAPVLTADEAAWVEGQQNAALEAYKQKLKAEGHGGEENYEKIVASTERMMKQIKKAQEDNALLFDASGNVRGVAADLKEPGGVWNHLKRNWGWYAAASAALLVASDDDLQDEIAGWFGYEPDDDDGRDTIQEGYRTTESETTTTTSERRTERTP